MSTDYLILGLGNPGPRYANTRHNVGFMCMDALARRHGVVLKQEAKMEAMVGRGVIDGQKVILAQPLTYMNLSGRAFQRLVQFYKVPLTQTLVILDDVALPLGKIRFRPSGSAGSHNGMKSILETMGTQAVPRLRIGIHDAPPEWDLADYVLAPFTPEEQAQLLKIITACADAVAVWLEEGVEKAMNRYNSLDMLSQP